MLRVYVGMFRSVMFVMTQRPVFFGVVGCFCCSRRRRGAVDDLVVVMATDGPPPPPPPPPTSPYTTDTHQLGQTTTCHVMPSYALPCHANLSIAIIPY